jgi:hypothetical protein
VQSGVQSGGREGAEEGPTEGGGGGAAAVEKWKATGDPEAAAYHMRLQEERMELFQMQETENHRILWCSYDSAPGCDEETVEAGRYRDRWNNPKRGTYEDTSKHTVRISLIPNSIMYSFILLSMNFLIGAQTDVSSDLLNYDVMTVLTDVAF